MNYELIFYLARRTGGCEDALREGLARAGLRASAVSVSTGEGELCYALAQAVNHCNLVFVVGGLNAPFPQNVHTVLSRALSVPLEDDRATLSGARALQSPGGPDGFLLESGRQTIVLLPDEPDQIARLLESELLSYLSDRYSLTLSAPPRAVPDAMDALPAPDVPPDVPPDAAPDVLPDVLPDVPPDAAPPAKGRAARVWKSIFWLVVALLLAAAAYLCGALFGLPF